MIDIKLKSAIEQVGIKVDFTEKHSRVSMTLDQLEEVCKNYLHQSAQKPVLYASLDNTGGIMYSEHTLSPLVSRKPKINGIDKPLYHLDVNIK